MKCSYLLFFVVFIAQSAAEDFSSPEESSASHLPAPSSEKLPSPIPLNSHKTQQLIFQESFEGTRESAFKEKENPNNVLNKETR